MDSMFLHILGVPCSGVPVRVPLAVRLRVEGPRFVKALGLRRFYSSLFLNAESNPTIEGTWSPFGVPFHLLYSKTDIFGNANHLVLRFVYFS